jgi:hypothetical protein
MLIDIPTPFWIIKHTKEGSLEAYHTFEVWEVPADPQELYDRALVASTLVQTFEGDYDIARDECRNFIARTSHLRGDDIPSTVWIEKATPLFAVGKDT